MAVDYTAKRQNWIQTGITLLFGPQSGQPVLVPTQRAGFFQFVLLIQAWLNEGVSCGFIAAAGSNTAPANAIADTDFTTGLSYPAVNATSFATAVAALQTLTTDYQSVYAAVAAIKP